MKLKKSNNIPLVERWKHDALTVVDQEETVESAETKKFSDPVSQKQDDAIKGRFEVMKSDDDKMLVFGWANVAVTVNGKRMPDLQGDLIKPEVLENAAYRFVEFYRRGGEMHYEGGGQVAILVESVVFTKEKLAAMGIPEGTVPLGWWIGFHVLDEEVWKKVKSGEYSMFSIEGEARRVSVIA